MSKLLIATHVKFWLENQGSSKRISSIIKYMSSKKTDVHVYYTGFLEKKSIKNIQETYKEYPISIYSDNYIDGICYSAYLKRKISSFLKNISKRYSHGIFFGKLQKNGFNKKYAYYRKPFFNRLVEKIRPDSIIVEYVYLAYLVEDLMLKNQRPTLLIDTHDLLSLRNKTITTAGLKTWIELSEEEELDYLRPFDTIIAIQATEALHLKTLLPGKAIITVPYPLQARRKVTKEGLPLTLGYVSGRGTINKDAIVTFIGDVWIRLVDRYGSALSLEIQGTICKDCLDFRDVPGVRLGGEFSDPVVVYDSIDIMVNPVRSGSGLKIKNVEALCHGMPLVTTPIGAQGLEDGINSAFLCGETGTEQFAAICELVDSVERRSVLSEQAFRFAADRFSEKRCYHELLRLVG